MTPHRVLSVVAATGLACLLAASAASAVTVQPARFVSLPAQTTMTSPRTLAAAAPSQGGALIFGGTVNGAFGSNGSTSTIDRFDAATGFRGLVSPVLTSTRYAPFAAALPGGDAIVGGGFDATGNPTVSAER